MVDAAVGKVCTGWTDRLAREHTLNLARVALREGLRAEEAIDAVQDAFVTFLGLPQARVLSENQAESLSLLCAVVRNAARNIRKRHDHSRPHVDLAELDIVDQQASVDELIVLAEAHAALLGCVQRLAEVQRHVVTLRMMDQLSGSEVAEALGIPSGHVAVTLHRAKSELRRCLANQ
jgi:RNA polymerase sigma-70 factor, ECF subfamily